MLFPFLALLAFFKAHPIFRVVYGSFKGGPPGTDAPFTLDGFVRAWSSWGTIKTLIATFALAVPRVVFGVTFAIFFSGCLTRTNTPGRRIFDQLNWLRIFLPYLPMVVAWIILAKGRTGLLNAFLMDKLHLSTPPLDIGSYWGIIFLSFMVTAGYYYLYMGLAFRNMDASLEESARASGASWLRIVRRVVLPLLAPTILNSWLLGFLWGTRALLLILFIYLLGSKVLSIDIFERMQASEPQEAAVLAMILAVISLVVAIIARSVAARQRHAMGGFM